MAEDDQALLPPSIQGHEHVDTGFLLHAPQLAAPVASHPALAVLRNVHLCGIFTARNVRNGHAASALLQQPLDELLATPALLHVSGNEGNVADVLQDSTCCCLQLLARGALLAEGVAEFIVLEHYAVSIEPLRVAGLVPDTTREGPWCFGLDAAHGLQLCSTTLSPGSEDDEHLAAAAPLALLTTLVHEEHEHTPLLLHGTKRCTPVTRDIADAVAGDVNDCAVVAVLPAIHVNWALQLLKEPLHVLARLPPMCSIA
mmetsp:Transcript_21323/g.48731  ORF Transcript_21323/g.48731 Transcript_21323/m.48731 type:complete len:257 (-) Transcript_21323:617-1387(-)